MKTNLQNNTIICAFLWLKMMLLLFLLNTSNVAYASVYMQTSGEYRVLVDTDVLDYPDSRASSIDELKKGSVIQTYATTGVKSGNYAFLSHLFEPTSRWMIVRTSTGQLGYVWCDSRFEKTTTERKLVISSEQKQALYAKGQEKYFNQGKQHLKWIGFAFIGVVVLMAIALASENGILGLIGGLSVFAFEGILIWYLMHNPHSMWFVSPSINGWGYTLLFIIPTWIVVAFFISEFIGSISGISKNIVNIIGAILLIVLLFFIGRAIYLEVLDLITLLIFALSGAGVRSSDEYGSLVGQATGKFITGVRFSGNKAYTGNRTFTNNGSGYFE